MIDKGCGYQQRDGSPLKIDTSYKYTKGSLYNLNIPSPRITQNQDPSQESEIESDDNSGFRLGNLLPDDMVYPEAFSQD